ncbi:MAG: DUF1206 domain-containing protein [Propionibacteriaceae bacterium]|nr:DUF1206 domain-containing protein [Propionibacteriaceae bacterium]
MSKREQVEAAAQQVEQHPVLAKLAGVGHAVNGIVHIIIGLIAISVARGAGGSADQSGAMRAIDSTPLGSIGLWAAALALFALALYSAAVAIGDIRHSKKEAARHAGRAVAYIAVGVVAVTYATGGTSDGEETAKSVSAQLMATTWGSLLLGAVGVGVLVAGITMVVKGIRKKFMDQVDVTGKTRRTFAALGMAGYIARGVAFGIIGILFVVAVLTNNPDEAGGMDGALKKLTELPFGGILLILVGAGLIMYGIFCFARARATARDNA